MTAARPDRRRSRATRFGALLCATVGVLVLVADLAQAAPASSRPGIAVVQVEGLLDPPMMSMVRDAVADANSRGRTMLVLQIDSKGALDADVSSIVRAINRSRVPIVAWVGPSGAHASGAAAEIVAAAHVAVASRKAKLGAGVPVRLDQPDAVSSRALARTLSGLADRRGRDAEATARWAGATVGAEDAQRAGSLDGVQPTLGEVVVSLDGRTVTTAKGDIELDTAKVVGKGRDRRRQPNQETVFSGLTLGQQVQHALIRPSTAYFLFVAGLALLAFEFFTIGVGLIGVGGALALVGACYGFSHLPTRWWAVGLLVVAVFGYSIDVQAGGLGPWTGIATLATVGGSLALYGGSSDLDPPWWILILVCGGLLLFFLWGMTGAVRARFSTPTVGREGMLGELGVADGDIAPDGTVLIRGAHWRARTNRATPITAGDTVRVIEIDGIVLEVEPETGGARDHRDRSPRHKGGAEAEAAESDAAPFTESS